MNALTEGRTVRQQIDVLLGKIEDDEDLVQVKNALLKKYITQKLEEFTRFSWYEGGAKNLVDNLIYASKQDTTVKMAFIDALLDDSSSLLPSGVQKVSGAFDRGDIVSVTDILGTKLAAGITNYESAELTTISGVQSNRIHELLGHHYGDEVIHRDNMVIL